MAKSCNNDLTVINVNSNELKASPTLPIITYNEIPYHEFYEKYIFANQACLIKNVAGDWESYNTWTKEGKINLEHLVEKYGNSTVTQYNCDKQYYNSQEATECPFKEYIKYWRDLKSHKTDKLLYLKDWHLKNQLPHDNFYVVPDYFKSDWLNEYLCTENQDDYRFVYMGPEKTWTPFHADVFMSFSWSVNICGLKRWVLLHPGEELKLKDHLGNLPFDIGDSHKSLRHYELIQRPGEAVFVPSGWYHQVWNVADTISVNHNWINGCNIGCVYNALCGELKNVRREISDCQDMEDFDERCQLIVKSTFGMDCRGFIDLVLFICDERVRMVECGGGGSEVLFDLKCVGGVLRQIGSSEFKNDRIVCALGKVEDILAVSWSV